MAHHWQAIICVLIDVFGMQELQRHPNPGQFIMHHQQVWLSIDALAFTVTWEQPLVDIVLRRFSEIVSRGVEPIRRLE